MRNAVVIAGAGPAGLMLACELGLAGIQATVIEPLPERSISSPGMAINSGCVEVLDQRGLMDAVRERALEFPSAHFSLLWLDLNRMKEQHASAFLVSQSWVEQVLEERATSLGADIRRGHEVRGLEQDESGVTALVHSADGDYQVRCRYLVGCDGENSTIRSLAGIGWTGTEDPACSGITGDVEVELTDLAADHLGAYVSSAGGIYTGAPIAPGILRVITIEYGASPPPRDTRVTAEEFHASIRRVTGTDLKSSEPRWLSRFGDAVRQAHRYRQGRVFLAGDAAHVLFPLNGLGLSTSVQDAVNLGWKLAANLQGWAPPGLLDSYQDERDPVGRQACRDVRAQAELLRTPERMAPLRALLGELLRFDDVQRYLIELVTGVDVRYSLGGPDQSTEPHPLLGRRLPHITLTTGTGECAVASTLHAGRGVLLNLSGAAADAGDVSGWKDRIDVVAVQPAAQIAATAVLLRPDGHVAWVRTTSPDEAGLRTALTTWFGEPSGADL
jgi:2-polyprenyl-6-methoxyphenol hydroxylase-like FAD-dependent oxidoreductase